MCTSLPYNKLIPSYEFFIFSILHADVNNHKFLRTQFKEIHLEINKLGVSKKKAYIQIHSYCVAFWISISTCYSPGLTKTL